MAGQKLTQRTLATSAADADLLHIVDVSDSTDSLEGTSKKITKDNFLTPSEILTKIKTVDGAGSGLDADTLDGINSTGFLKRNVTETSSGTLRTANQSGIIGSSTGTANVAFYGLYESNNTTRQGYMGFASSEHSDFIISNDSAGTCRFRLQADTGFLFEGGIIKSNGNLNLTATSGETRYLQIGHDRSGNGTSFIDLVGDATYSDYGLRVIRGSGGANTNSDIIHKGTGEFRFISSEAGSITFRTNNTLRLTIASTGAATFTSTVTATNFILSSDKRLKSFVKDIQVDKLQVEFKQFKLKGDSNLRYGVIAQDLEVFHPQFVRTDEDGIKSVAYIDLLIAKINELENRIKTLEK